MRWSHKKALAVVRRGLVLALALAVVPSHGNGYPQRPINLLVGRGSGSDGLAAAQALADRLNRQLAHPIRVDDRTSNSVAAAARSLAKAGSRGQTLMLASPATHLFDPPFERGSERHTNVSTSILLGVFETAPMVCVVRAGNAADSVGRVLSNARTRGGLRLASAGKRSHSGVTGQITLRALGLSGGASDLAPVTHLALNSTATAVASVIKGSADYTCVPYPVVRSLLVERQLKALFATSTIDGLDTPSAARLGRPELASLDAWYGLAGPTRMDRLAIEAWQGWLTRLSRDDTFRAAALARGFRAGPAVLMLRSQARAVLKKHAAAIQRLADQYAVPLR